jgi:hypothetical protein
MCAPIMDKSFYLITSKKFFTAMAFFTSAHVWIHLNKMALLNVNIATFLMWPGVYVFKPIFQFLFGVNAFS